MSERKIIETKMIGNLKVHILEPEEPSEDFDYNEAVALIWLSYSKGYTEEEIIADKFWPAKFVKAVIREIKRKEKIREHGGRYYTPKKPDISQDFSREKFDPHDPRHFEHDVETDDGSFHIFYKEDD